MIILRIEDLFKVLDGKVDIASERQLQDFQPLFESFLSNFENKSEIFPIVLSKNFKEQLVNLGFSNEYLENEVYVLPESAAWIEEYQNEFFTLWNKCILPYLQKGNKEDRAKGLSQSSEEKQYSTQTSTRNENALVLWNDFKNAVSQILEEGMDSCLFVLSELENAVDELLDSFRELISYAGNTLFFKMAVNDLTQENSTYVWMYSTESYDKPTSLTGK